MSDLRLRLSSTSADSRGPIVLHARSVFGGAMAFSRQVSNVANKVGGAGRPGSSDPQLRYELTLRNLVTRLDEVRAAMSLVVEEHKSGLNEKLRIRASGSKGNRQINLDIPGTNFTSTSSLYWLLQNGAIAIFALADPMIVAGQGMSSLFLCVVSIGNFWKLFRTFGG